MRGKSSKANIFFYDRDSCFNNVSESNYQSLDLNDEFHPE